MPEATNQLTRRETLKLGGAAAVATVGGITLVKRVAATDSGHAELTVNGTIPDGTSVDATVEEYDTEDASTPINTQTVTILDAGTAHAFDGLEGSGDYHYARELVLNSDDAQELTPELESPLFFEVPPPDPDDFEFVDYTSSKEWEEKPDDVEIAWDEYRLRKYRPKLVMDEATRRRMDGLYGYVAKSDEEETDVLCYWSKFDESESLPIGNNALVSDIGDHDPIYVFVDKETDEIDRIVYSGFQLDAAEVQPSEDELETSDFSGDPTHATFEVVSDWHHYRYAPEKIGHLNYELKPWPEVRETWQSNNFGPDAAAVENPWRLLDEDDWRDNDGLFSLTDMWLDVAKSLGWYGADETDDLRA